jgi:putative DNA primase/helicase
MTFPIHYSRGADRFDNLPEQRKAATFDGFEAAVLSDRSPKKGLVYICGPLMEGVHSNPDKNQGEKTWRQKHLALPRAFLSFDFDGFDSPEKFTQLKEWLSLYRGFGYTTASHTQDAPRCRIVLAVTRTISREEGKALSLAIQHMIQKELGVGMKFDESVYNAEQPLYTPLKDAETFHFDGSPVDVDEVLANVPILEKKKTTTAIRREATIAAIDPVLKKLQLADMVKKDIGNGKHAVDCPCASAHTGDSNETSTVYYLPHFGGVRYGKFHCLHDHCRDRPQEQFLEALGLKPKEVWRQQAGGSVTAHDFEASTDETEKEVIVRLSKLSQIEYDRIRIVTADSLGVRVSALDAEVKQARKGVSEEQSIVEEAEPYAEAVNLSDVLNEVRQAFNRHAILPPNADVALTLWCAFSWFIEGAQIAPLLVIRAPESECGKTTVKDIVELFVRRPLSNEGITLAALFRVVEQFQPTLLLDDADSWLLRDLKDERHSLINSGHKRGGKVLRCAPDTFELQSFSTFCAKAIIFIGKSKDTLHNRSIEILLRRKVAGESIIPLRTADREQYDLIRAKLARVEVDYLSAFAKARPSLPPGLENRAADNWEPLFAIADLVGGDWPELARNSALALIRSREPVTSIGVELLTDIARIFDTRCLDRIRTEELLQELCADQEAMWSTYNRGRPITPRQIAKRLDEYSIKPKTIRFGYQNTAKGYEVKQFRDAFDRYLHATLEQDTLSVTTSQLNEHEDLSVTDDDSIDLTVTQSVTPKPLLVGSCDGVTDEKEWDDFIDSIMPGYRQSKEKQS